jgi:3alpha(or 20beta)-hydroxysteroid dehydrogenase
VNTGDRLAGKVALVTGAAQGIGAAIARKLTQHGARVIVADIQHDRGRQVAASLGVDALFQPLDVCDPKSWSTAIDDLARNAAVSMCW